MAAIKKKRASNFTQEDKMLLVNFICEKKHIIESKKTDSQTIRHKQLLWRLIWKKYNEQSSTRRTVDSLRFLWDNLKKRSKRKIVKAGIDSKDIKEDPLLSKVYDIIKLSAHGMNNPLDSDCLYNEDLEHETMCESSKENDIELDEFEANSNSSSHSSPVLKEQANISYPAPYLHVIAHIPKQENIYEETDNTCIETPQICNITQVPQIPSSNLSVSTANGETQKIVQQRPSLQSSTDILVEEKITLVQTTKQHAIDEEERKKELFSIQIEKEKLQLEMLKLDLMRKKLEFERDFPDL